VFSFSVVLIVLHGIRCSCALGVPWPQAGGLSFCALSSCASLRTPLARLAVVMRTVAPGRPGRPGGRQLGRTAALQSVLLDHLGQDGQHGDPAGDGCSQTRIVHPEQHDHSADEKEHKTPQGEQILV